MSVVGRVPSPPHDKEEERMQSHPVPRTVIAFLLPQTVRALEGTPLVDARAAERQLVEGLANGARVSVAVNGVQFELEKVTITLDQ